MSYPINPFHELYVTETISSKNFVDVFSDMLVQHALELFQNGNVVLRGVQGSGKSMLLNLLRPEIRLAYAEAEREFPIPLEFRAFIGAGINLTRSGAIAFGQRAIDGDADQSLRILPLYFGDFLNYWIVRDILKSLNKLRSEPKSNVAAELGIASDRSRLDYCAETICQDPCWYGFLSGITSFAKFEQRISSRLAIYRNFFNFNIETIPDEVRMSKTGIGDPISRTAELLWEFGVVPRDVPFYVRIDQYEQLRELGGPFGQPDLGRHYAATVNRLLGMRDSRVSYRIGVRHYAWRDHLEIFGTTSVLEQERNYRVVDLDSILRRREQSPGLFPRFAEDVFRRRVLHARYRVPSKIRPLDHVLGRDFAAENKAARYVRSGPDGVVNISDLPAQVGEILRTLALTDPLDAKLGEAWTRQQLKRKRPKLPREQEFPWKEKAYWVKERVQQALMQIAKGRGQSLVWGGKKEILALAGANILVFVSISQQIWAAWIRSIRETEEVTSGDLPQIDLNSQNEGIQLASSYWHEKMTELPGGHDRQRFADLLGRMFAKELLGDGAMSNPGFNGFSLQVDDLEQCEAVRSFLESAVDHAALDERPHTTKNKNRIRRRKWYLNPVLSAYYQLPVAHNKEPMYTGTDKVTSWLIGAGILARNDSTRRSHASAADKKVDDRQKHLFPT